MRRRWAVPALLLTAICLLPCISPSDSRADSRSGPASAPTGSAAPDASSNVAPNAACKSAPRAACLSAFQVASQTGVQAVFQAPFQAVSHPASPYTEEERQWIADHPRLRIGVDPDSRPLEYVEQGVHRGLSADYMAAIGRASGLSFDVVPLANSDVAQALADRRVDLLASVSRGFAAAAVREQLDIGMPYYVGGTIIVTGAYGEIVFDPHKLDGKVVAIKGGGMLEEILRRQYPAIAILSVATPALALAAVAEGRASAAIGVDSVLLPIMYRSYRDRLHVSGTMAETPAVLSIGVRRDLPLLAGIVEKSLATITARQSDAIVARWIEQGNYVAPSWMQILRSRPLESGLIAATLLLLALAAWHALRARRAAERSEQDKTRFLAVMSHEIRTPMNAILASVELLARSPLTPSQRQLGDLAASASVALLELLDDVLDLSKLEARRTTLQRSPTDIGQLAHGVLALAAAQAHRKQLDIALQLDVPDATMVLVDATRIRQILINLLSNAVKFTERGSVKLRIALETAATESTQPKAGPAPEPESGLTPARAALVLNVTDTGAGVSEADRKQVFHPYVQARDIGRRFGGTGLGLTICRELCELMGGGITFDSAPGVGSSVTCRLPVEWIAAAGSRAPAAVGDIRPAAPTAAAQDAQMDAQMDKRTDAQTNSRTFRAARLTGTPDTPARILVVEDHPANRLVLQRQLEALGYTATIVADGRGALAQTTQHAFALMLLDCQLPDIDGYAVAAAQRAREAGGDLHLPIIAISASVDQAHLDACQRSGMDGTLRKPLQLDALRSLLAAWCGPGTPLQASDGAAGDAAQLSDTGVAAPAPNTLFIDSTREDLLALETALTLHDAAHAARIAHRMRGAALVCDFPAIAHTMTRIETLIRRQTPGGSAANAGHLAPLITELQQLIAAASDSEN